MKFLYQSERWEIFWWQIESKVPNRENEGFQVKRNKAGKWEDLLILESNIEPQKIEEHFVIFFLEEKKVKFFVRFWYYGPKKSKIFN